MAVDRAAKRLFLLSHKTIKCKKDERGNRVTTFQPKLVVWDLSAKTVTNRLWLKKVEPITDARYDMALTPNGKTLLVAREEEVYFLE